MRVFTWTFFSNTVTTMGVLSKLVIGAFVVGALALLGYAAWRYWHPPPRAHTDTGKEQEGSETREERAEGERPAHSTPLLPHLVRSDNREAKAAAKSVPARKGTPEERKQGWNRMVAFIDRHTQKLNQKRNLSCLDIQEAKQLLEAKKDEWFVTRADVEKVSQEYAWRNISTLRLLRLGSLARTFEQNGYTCPVETS